MEGVRTSENFRIPKAGRKARLVSALMVFFGGLGLRTDRQPKIETKPSPPTPDVQPDTREIFSLDGLTITSFRNPEGQSKLQEVLRNADAILQPTLVKETTTITELVDLETLLNGLQNGTLQVEVVPVTQSVGGVIYGLKANGDDLQFPFELGGHAYALHEDHFSYDLAEKYKLGSDFVIVTIQPKDPITGKISDENIMTTLLRSGNVELPQDCNKSGLGQVCSVSSIRDWLSHELESASVGVQYFFGH